MPPAAEFDTRPARLELWRAVEAQHVASTMMLVDTREEQLLLERLLEQAKPAVPDSAAGLHYLLFTPFRYPPTAYGSRFRRRGDPGVFYGAEEVRTACAELGYWRWRFLIDSSDLDRITPAPQTVFKVAVRGDAIDLRQPPLARQQGQWTHPTDYAACQALAATAREAGVALIRYQSVRDPEAGGAAAVLDPAGFEPPEPLALETWYLGITRERIWWVRERFRGEDLGFEFEMSRWKSDLA